MLRNYQKKASDNTVSTLTKVDSTVLCLPTGGGKCLAPDTPVLLFDGSIKIAKDIKVGDSLMGFDSKKRVVTSICEGEEEMFTITPIKGKSFTVNKSHILSLRMTGNNCATVAPNGKRYFSNDIVNISVEDYLKASKTFKHCAKIWRVGVEFSEKTVRINPYFLGLWLGDGTSKMCAITTPDIEIVDYINEYANENGLNVRVQFQKNNKSSVYYLGYGRTGRKGGKFNNDLKFYGIYNNKHIPFDYKTSSFEQRLELLAGLMDSDGSLHNGGFDYISKSQRLAEDVAFVCQSVGLFAKVLACEKSAHKNHRDTYYRVSISGDCSIIPCKVIRKQASKRLQKKNVLNTGFTVSFSHYGKYNGFTLEGSDRLFLLGDFTVTHNTVIFSEFAKNWHQIKNIVGSENDRVIILTDRVELLKQTLKTSQQGFVGDIGLITADNFYVPKTAKLIIGMVETYYRRLEKGFKIPNLGLCINDEAHRSAFNKIMEHPNHQVHKTIGATATPLSSDIKNPMKKYYKDIVIGTDINSLIQEGFLANPSYYGTKVDIDAKQGKFDYVNKDLFNDFDKSIVYTNTVENYYKHANNEKTIVFCVNILHAQKTTASFVSQGFNAKCLVSTDSKATRKYLLKWFAETKNAILVNCGILTTGFDEPTIQNVILNRATTSIQLYLQMVGRGARVLPSKKSFKVIDMGNNINQLGFWEQPRDWEYAFWNPQEFKQNEDGQIELSKQCPQCEAIQRLKVRICGVCGYDFSKVDEMTEYEAIMEKIDNKSFHYLYSKNPESMTVQELIQRAKMGSPFSDKVQPYSSKWILFQLKKRRNFTEALQEFAAIKGFSEKWIDKQINQK